MEIKTKINKWDLIILKSFWTAKDFISKVKKAALRTGENNSKWNNWQWMNLQNVQEAHAARYQKNDQPNKKWASDLNRHFSKDIQMANKHVKRCSVSQIIRKMRIKTTMRYHLTQVRMAIIKMSTNNKMLERVGRKGNMISRLVGMQTGIATMEKSVQIP